MIRNIIIGLLIFVILAVLYIRIITKLSKAIEESRVTVKANSVEMTHMEK